MRYEVEPTAYVLRVYDEDATNYVASATIRVYGDRGWVSSISSPQLFKALKEHFVEFMEQLDLATLEGYMSDAMATALQMKARGWAKFEISHYGICAGRRMPWVVLSKLEVSNGQK